MEQPVLANIPQQPAALGVLAQSGNYHLGVTNAIFVWVRMVYRGQCSSSN